VAALAVTLTAADDPDGTTPLHWAVRANDLDAAQHLIHAGANPDAANRYGVTPLSLAAEDASAPMIQMLLQAGAHPKIAPAQVGPEVEGIAPRAISRGQPAADHEAVRVVGQPLRLAVLDLGRPGPDRVRGRMA